MSFHDSDPNDNRSEPIFSSDTEGFRNFKSFHPIRQEKNPRVGIVTLSITLIGLGVLLLLNLFMKDFPIWSILKFSPVILILAGLELLISNLIHREQKAGFNFWSMMLCILLILASLAGCMGVPIMEAKASREKMEHRAENEIQEDVTEVLQNERIKNIYVSFFLKESEYSAFEVIPADTPYQEAAGAFLDINIFLSGKYDSAGDFTKEVRKLLDKMEPLDLPDPSIYFETEDTENSYRLSVDSVWERNLSADDLIPLIRP